MTTVVGAPPGVIASGFKVGVFTPPSLAGLVGWYDADDASTFTYQGGAPNVLTWQDKSPSPKMMTARDTNPQRNGIQNGRTTVVFNLPSYMDATAPLTTATTNVTMFAACKRTGGDTSTSVVFFNGNPAQGGYGIASRASGANIGMLRGALGWNATATPDPAAPAVMTLCNIAGTWTMYLNGTATNMNAAASVNAPVTTTRLVNTEHPWAGQLFEAIMYNRALSTTERQQVETYLRTKWGTP